MNSQQPKRTRDHLRPDEVEALLSAAKNGSRDPERNHAILLLLANHALRASELTHLHLSDINLNGEPSIYIRHQKGEEPSVHPLQKSDVIALRKWLAIRNRLQLHHDYLFCSQQLKPLNRATLNLLLTTVARKAGLEHLRPHPHTLRSSCATYLLNQGVTIRDTQDWLGHKDVRTTARYCKLAANRFKNIRLF
jgi:site-specific recombinase XerD